MASKRADIVLPDVLRARVNYQMGLTGENMSEYIRRCLLKELEVAEAKQAELRMMEQAVQNGLSA